jgi:putative peptide zinc metalloprotease protein
VWFLHHFFGRGLGLIATGISVMLVVGAVLGPLREFVARLRHRRADPTLSPRRLRNGLAVCAAMLAVLLFVPLPYSVNAPFVVFPGDAQPVFVTVPGRVETAAAAGTSVRAGQTVGELLNHEMLLQHERQSAEVARLSARLWALEAQRGKNESAAIRLPATRDELASARRRMQQLTDEVQRLQLKSPADGIVLPPPNQPRPPTADDALPDWYGTPLQSLNRGATLPAQTLFCYVGDPARQDALLLVDQNAIEFVRPGQSVRLQLRSAPAATRHGRVEEVASTRSESVPRELTVTHSVAVRQTHGRPAPAEVSYEVRVRLTDQSVTALYSPGQARVDCGTLSLASRLWRLLRHTFSADWSGPS